MSEPTLEQRLADSDNKCLALEGELEQARAQMKAMRIQIETMQSGLGTVQYSPDVLADIRERMAAGLPKEIAIERALHQAEHNRKLAEADDAEDIDPAEANHEATTKVLAKGIRGRKKSV